MDVTRKALVAVTAVGLGIDAYIHLKLAPNYSGVGEPPITQGLLFRVEGVLAILAATFLLIRPGRFSAACAALVAGGGTFALLLYLYVDVGSVGPMPDMYEPVWYAEKTITAIAQSIATVTAVWVLIIGVPRASHAAAQDPEHARST